MTRIKATRLVRAARRLHEAGIPPSVLSPMDLLAFRPDQWPTLIHQALHFGRLAEVSGPSATAVFREAYRRATAPDLTEVFLR